MACNPWPSWYGSGEKATCVPREANQSSVGVMAIIGLFWADLTPRPGCPGNSRVRGPL
jgi:hypothetical protein